MSGPRSTPGEATRAPRTQQRVRDYAIGIGAALLALGGRAALEPWLHGHLPFLLAFGGVTLAVWLAGAGPALAAAVIGYLGSNMIVRGQPIPSGLFGGGYWIALLAYLLSSGAIIAFGVVIRGAHARLLEEIAVRRRAEDEAVRSQQALTVEDRRKNEFLGRSHTSCAIRWRRSAAPFTC
jgi:hypothetical protein